MEIRLRKFPYTIDALAAYDAGAPARQAAWDRISCAPDVERAELADKLAVIAVQDAYYLDTQDINSHENCRRIHVSDIRKVATP